VQWNALLSSPDQRVSYSCGELLLTLCARKVPRLVRHVGFEAIAGYLHTSNLLAELQEDDDSRAEELSSDEEYFNSKLPEASLMTPDAPRSAEEVEELDELMQKIHEYSVRMAK